MDIVGHTDTENADIFGHTDTENADILGHTDTENADILGHTDTETVDNFSDKNLPITNLSTFSVSVCLLFK